MDFIKYKCPVCGESFKKGDDIVVCPECGAPHHRTCYEKENRCFYSDKHSEGFSYENTEAENQDDHTDEQYVKCSVCGAENPKEIFYCQRCGSPLGKTPDSNQTDQTGSRGEYNNRGNQGSGGPFPFGYAGTQFDPMAGMDSSEPIADNITAGEMARFIGKSTPYFMRVFARIKRFGSSRYNFCSFLLPGIYFLYRKMYALGALFSFLAIGTYVGTYYIYTTAAYQSAYSAVAANASSYSMFSVLYLDSSVLTFEQAIIFNLPTILNAVLLAVQIICGAIANRAYYKHCVKAIGNIKSQNPQKLSGNELELRGGVNLASAICIGVVYVAVMYLPIFM